jgi:hypothetical protein
VYLSAFAEPKMELPELLDEFSKRPDSARFQDRIEIERRSRPGMVNYFEDVFLAYRIPVEDRQYSLAIERGLWLLDYYQRNASDFDAQHKGSPFYVMGYAAFASHDYRRDYLRALAQRVEVDAQELRIMGSKSELLRTLVAASSAGTAAFGVPSTEVAHPTRFERVPLPSERGASVPMSKRTDVRRTRFRRGNCSPALSTPEQIDGRSIDNVVASSGASCTTDAAGSLDRRVQSRVPRLLMLIIESIKSML